MWSFWPFSSNKPPEKPKPEPTPSREDRTRCWGSRDEFFACLDASKIISPTDRKDACAEQAQNYERDCAKSWITYFNQRRVIAVKQAHMLDSQTRGERKKA